MKKDVVKAGDLLLEDVKVYNEKLYLDGRRNFIIRPHLIKRDGFNIFNSTSVKKLAENIKKITNKRYILKPLDIYIDISNVDKFEDKNTYILLDLLIFNLIVKTKTNKKIFMNIGNFKRFNDVTSIGIYNTAFMRSLISEKNNMVDREIFIEKYLKNTTSYSEEYKEHLENSVKFVRYIITESIFNESTLDKISTNIYYDLSHSFGEEHQSEWVDEVTKVLGEILSNSYTHNKLFTIIDMDIPDLKMINDNKDTELCIGLNISIVNIGEKNICKKMSDGVLNEKFNKNIEIYQKVFKAYENHKPYFQEKEFVTGDENPYTLNHFLLLTAFQERVTTRYMGTKKDVGKYSGVGLTELINNIQKKIRIGASYVMSEDVSIIFQNELLVVNKDGTIGFNKTNDYVKDIPDRKILGIGDMTIPGTLYQLHLVLDRYDEK